MAMMHPCAGEVTVRDDDKCCTVDVEMAGMPVAGGEMQSTGEDDHDGLNEISA